MGLQEGQSHVQRWVGMVGEIAGYNTSVFDFRACEPPDSPTGTCPAHTWFSIMPAIVVSICDLPLPSVDPLQVCNYLFGDFESLPTLLNLVSSLSESQFPLYLIMSCNYNKLCQSPVTVTENRFYLNGEPWVLTREADL
jgi:hypothetical protein